MPKGVPNKRYAPKFKKMVVETIEKENLSIRAAMQEFGINSAPVQKITIVPRTSGALDYTMQVDDGTFMMMTEEKNIGKVDIVALETVSNRYLGGDASLACSAETQTRIDRLAVDIVKSQHEKAKIIIADNKSKLDELAQYLYEHETITGDKFMSILNA